ncbi:hypothetical protein D6783_04610 [Candidatus Woesearchaeota archaeon]|nr:MAG: hypothetical protein D6783_04610 [Candidatus Woesearchaeota archaeon]
MQTLTPKRNQNPHLAKTLLLLLLLILTTTFFTSCSQEALPKPQGTAIFPEPQEHEAKEGEQFTIAIKGQNLNDLSGFQFNLAYDPQVLEAVRVEEGEFLKRAGETFKVGPDLSTAGLIANFAVVKLGGGGKIGTGVSGSGTLATITFKAKKKGTSQLAFENVKFVNPPSDQLSVQAFPGRVTVT